MFVNSVYDGVSARMRPYERWEVMQFFVRGGKLKHAAFLFGFKIMAQHSTELECFWGQNKGHCQTQHTFEECRARTHATA